MQDDKGDWQPLLEGRGARIVLPPRDHSILRVIGTALMAIGLVGGGAAAYSLCVQVWPPSTLDTGDLFRAFAALVVTVWFGWVFLSGLFGSYGHAELILTDDAVIGVERCGPVRTSRRVPRSAIEHIEVLSVPWQDLATLQIARRHHRRKQRVMWFLLGYPRARVEAIAATLRTQLGHGPVGELHDAESETVRVDGIVRAACYPALARPALSSAVVARTTEGLTIELPALGFFRGSKGLGTFSVLWLAFVVVVGTGTVVLLSQGEPRNAVFSGFVFALFFVVGVAFFTWALHSGKRRGIIQVSSGTLTIVTESLGAPRTRSWPREALRSIGLGPSGMVNGQPLLELQVHSKQGGPIGFFVERDDAELAWLAAELSTVLELERKR